jgi:hypothetical protein
MKNIVFVPNRKLLIHLGLLTLVTIVLVPAYADQVVKSTSGGTMNVGFLTDPTKPNTGSQTSIKISFMDKQTNLIQQHVDYRVFVMQGNNQVYGIPLDHTVTGFVNIPLQFHDAGTFQVIVEVYGMLFQPMLPETATFTVTTENHDSSQCEMTIPSWIKSTAGWWAKGKTGDSDFIVGIQYLIQQGIMKIPQQGQNATGQHIIPAWVKYNAGWWAQGQISNCEFGKGIQWLISNGVITA